MIYLKAGDEERLEVETDRLRHSVLSLGLKVFRLLLKIKDDDLEWL